MSLSVNLQLIPTARLHEKYNVHKEFVLGRLSYYTPSEMILIRIMAPLQAMYDELIRRGMAV
jgi:hypothetical protein